MAVPYTFATATSAIPLSNLDSNFATAITIGSTATYLGNTTTTIAGLTLTSPTLTTPALGTPASGVLTNCTGYPGSAISGTINLATQVTGTLPVLNGGTGVTSSTGTGNVVLSTTPTLVTPILGTPTSGTLTNTTGFPAANLAGTALPAAIVTSSLTSVGTITSGTWTGTTIAIANGGTGQTTASAAFNALSPITTTGDLILGNGTNSATRLGIGTNGYVLTVSGGTAVWAAAAGGGSQATATALGTVYAKQTTGGGTPFLTAFGYNAGVSTTAVNNTAIGTEALFTNVNGDSHVAVGYRALYKTNVIYSNTGLGAQALYNSTTGVGNTAVGQAALYNNITSNYNVAVGYSSLNNCTGEYNVGIGALCSASLIGGSYNTFLGHASGGTIINGANNTYLGKDSSASSTATNYEVVLGAGSTGKGSNTGFFAPNSGVYQGNNATAWSTTSDQRLKKNIVDNNVGLEKITQIQVRNFEYRVEDEVIDLPKHSVIKKQGVQLGVIAQELQQVLPDCVTEQSTGVLSVNSDNIMWHMINAIKELNAKVIALEARVGV